LKEDDDALTVLGWYVVATNVRVVSSVRVVVIVAVAAAEVVTVEVIVVELVAISVVEKTAVEIEPGELSEECGFAEPREYAPIEETNATMMITTIATIVLMAFRENIGMFPSCASGRDNQLWIPFSDLKFTNTCGHVFTFFLDPSFARSKQPDR
jgi:hypothetical protein